MNKVFPRRRQRSLPRLVALIPLLLAACDNVQWGGARVSIGRPALDRAVADSISEDTLPGPPAIELPSGPVLFHVRRLDPAGRATMEPVLELAGGELRAVGIEPVDRASEYAALFNERYYPRDRTYTLFRGEARVGTFVVRAPVPAGATVCPALLAEGQLELAPAGSALVEFLAWPPGTKGGVEGLESVRFRPEMRDMASVLAARGVRERGIAGRWRVRAPLDLVPLRVGVGPRGFAATFLVGDSLGAGSPPDSAGMVFLVADYDPARGYFPIYFEAHWYGPDGKRALRWIDAVELTSDTGPEWLVKAYGVASSWYEVIARRDTARTVVWSGRRRGCEATPPSSP